MFSSSDYSFIRESIIQKNNDDPSDYYLNQLLAQYEKEWPDNPDFLDDYRDVYFLPEFQKALSRFKLKINSKYYEPNHEKRYICTKMMGCTYYSETQIFKNLNQKIDAILPSMISNMIYLFKCLLDAIKENPFTFLITLALLYQYFAQSQMAAASYTYDDPKKLKETIHRKIIYDTGTVKTECDKIKKPLLEIANNKIFSNQYLFYLLAQPNFYFKCSKFDSHTDAAYYEDQQIHYFQEIPPVITTLQHEMYHAVFNFLMLNSKVCYLADTSNLSSRSPYLMHPIAYTPEDIDQYHQDFEDGDKNIKDLAALIYKKKTDNLDADEEAIYLEKIKPFEEMLPYYMYMIVPKHQVHTLAKDSRLLGRQLVELKHLNQQFRGFFSIQHADALVEYIVGELGFYHQRYPKKNTHPVIRIMEREAHTFEMSQKIQKKFYGKAYARHLGLLKLCSDFSPEVKEKDSTLRVKKGL